MTRGPDGEEGQARSGEGPSAEQDTGQGAVGGSELSDVDKPPLLTTPDYGETALNFTRNVVHLQARRLNPVWAAMSNVTIPIGVEQVAVDVNGQSIASPVVPLRLESPEIDAEDILYCNVEAFHEVVHAVATSLLDQVQEPSQAYLDAVLGAVGNHIEVKKEDYDWDLHLQLLDKIEWAVGVGDQVVPPSTLAGADIPALGEPTEEQVRRLQEIANTKQEEYVARRRRRRLR